ncbi:hypothetical protein PR202_ga29742 [Eleusine coracana subsp. coracana]|uniref:PGG domain-containing protein n=1 Tax=Eleusine coracana subsp. coracana TaxID=191504 RepID=A0AAV5DMN4_ELECO|nr:hypothetical protein PR202_ga29742 [Eleusine coracana subsp. coracana]
MASDRGDPWEYSLRKYLLLLATLVATVTYTAAFNPPGGVWQDSDPAAGHLAGDPIIRNTNYLRYLVFFYSNATAFASSIVVILLIRILAILHDRRSTSLAPLRVLRLVMVLDLLSLVGAYAAGTCRDEITAVYSSVLSVGVVVYLLVHLALSSSHVDGSTPGRHRKVLMLLGTFAASVTYLAGLSAPGGFWDHAEGAHRPGDAVLKGGRHDARLKAFFICNTTAFVASLLILVLLLLEKKLRSLELYGFIVVALVGLVGAYSAGSCRETDTTIYVNALIGAVLACVLVQVVVVKYLKDVIENSGLWRRAQHIHSSVSTWLQERRQECLSQEASINNDANVRRYGPTCVLLLYLFTPSTLQIKHSRSWNGIHLLYSPEEQQSQAAMEKARSLVLLLATLAAAITYQAGLCPPGGLWQDDDPGHKAGDPVLLTTNPRRYKAFFYCNSVAFVASVVAIGLVRRKTLHQHNALEVAMVLDLMGLIGAYAAGSCRDVSTSIYAVGLAGAVLVYVVIHVILFTLDHNDANRIGNDEASLEKKRKRLLLFAILAATITYQAGLTPPSGFLLEDDQRSGHRAGDPVLLYNYPRRYKAFFYCNSVSFMLSMALIILLVNPNLYRPAIRSNALSVCTVAGLMGIMGAFAAGSTQHLKTSIYIFVLVAVVLTSVVLFILVFLVKHAGQEQEDRGSNNTNRTDVEVHATANADRAGDSFVPLETEDGAIARSEQENAEAKKLHAKRKYLMLLGILVASVAYQAGLVPPGGVWQSDLGGHAAGNPVMHDNRRPRYLVFFYSNSTSFVASIVVIILLLPESLQKEKWWLGVMNTTIVLDLLGLLVAYAAGSSRSWQTSAKVSALVVAVLAYFAIHVVLSCFSRRGIRLWPLPFSAR